MTVDSSSIINCWRKTLCQSCNLAVI